MRKSSCAWYVFLLSVLSGVALFRVAHAVVATDGTEFNAVDAGLAALGPAPVARTDTLDDLLNWVDHSISFAAWITGKSVDDTQSMLRQKTGAAFSMSTAFSGIGAPEHAMASILRHIKAEPITRLYAIEIFQESRRELHCMQHVVGCVFDDINRFWNPDVDESSSLQELTDRIQQGDAVRTGPGNGWCCTHQSWACSLRSASFHVGGTPCPDWSTQGSRENEYGDDLLATMAWVAMRWQLEDEIFLNENVAPFPAHLVLAALAAKYVIMSCVIKVEKFWIARRHRRITFGILKSKLIVNVPWDPFCSAYRRSGAATWRNVFVASNAELEAELRWARRRKKSLYHKSDEHLHNLAEADDRCQADASVLGRIIELKHKSAFTDTLTWWELHNIDKYLQFVDPTTPFEVGQDAYDWPMYGTNVFLPCVIAGMQMLFSALHWRWLTPHEVLLAQGFCAMPQWDHILGKTCFHTVRSVFLRKRHIMFQQAGDSMPTPMIGHCIIWALSCVEELKQPVARVLRSGSSSLRLRGKQPVTNAGKRPAELLSTACITPMPTPVASASSLASVKPPTFFALAAGAPIIAATVAAASATRTAKSKKRHKLR